MTAEEFAEAIGRGMAQVMLAQKTVADKPRRRHPRRGRVNSGGTSAPATPGVIPPIQQSMFEPPNAGVPTDAELDKILNITRNDDSDPPGTYRPDESEHKPWLAR